jgi:hypothetical protein
MEINDYQTMKIAGPVKSGQHVMCDGQAVYLCDQTWNKLERIDTGNLPTWEEGENKVSMKSNFSGNEDVQLQFEGKFIGKPEVVARQD